uniref:DUF6531 domain-containing protein n=1 Tax=Candidatus Cyanaurora vandensis TaxID=2714958 RepID=UPI00257FA8BE
MGMQVVSVVKGRNEPLSAWLRRLVYLGRKFTALLLVLLLVVQSLLGLAQPVLAQTITAPTLYTPALLLDNLPANPQPNQPDLLEVITTPFKSPQLRLGNLLVSQGTTILQVNPTTAQAQVFARTQGTALTFGATSAAPFVLTPEALVQLSDGSQSPLGKVLFRQELPKGEGLAALGGVPTEDGEIFVVTQAGQLFAINPSLGSDTLRPITLSGPPLGQVSSLAFVPDLTDKTIGQLWATLPTQNKLIELVLTTREGQLQAQVVQELTGLVQPWVVRHAQGADQLWVLSREGLQVTVLDRAGALVRKLQLPPAAWTSMAVAESATQVEQVYLTRQQGDQSQVWQMPVTPLTLVQPTPGSTLTGQEFTLRFNRPVSLARLTNETIQLKRGLTGESLPIGLQLVQPDTVKVLVLGTPTGTAVLEIGTGLSDRFGNGVRAKISLAVQLVTASTTTAPPSDTTPPPSTPSVQQGSDLEAPTALKLAPIPTTLELLPGITLTTKIQAGLPQVHQTVTLTNTTGKSLRGPLYLSVERLKRGVVLTTPTQGYAIQSGGWLVPVTNLGTVLGVGQRVRVLLTFNATSVEAVKFSPRVLNASQQAQNFTTDLGPLQRVNHERRELVLTNTSPAPLTGPLYVRVALPAGARLLQLAGYEDKTKLPVVLVKLGGEEQLPPGKSVTVPLEIVPPPNGQVTVTAQVLGIPNLSLTPRLDTVSPNTLSVNQTTRLTLRGLHLKTVTQVQFSSGADIVSRILHANDTEQVIEVIVNPTALPGPRTLKLAGTNGRSNALDFIITPPPVTQQQTTLTGRVLTGELVARPLAGVRVSLEQFPGQGEAFTNKDGYFTLRNLPERLTTITVDGQVISTPKLAYPKIVTPAQIVAGQANVLPFTVYLTANDPTGRFKIPTVITEDLVLKPRRAPGLEVKLPAGLKITRFDGTPVTELIITTVRPDRSPMPYPVAIAPVQLLSIQPADAILSQPVQVTYPNLNKTTQPNAQVDLYRADHETESGDYIYYGTGRVSLDGRQVVPEIDAATGTPYGLPSFSWHFPVPQPQNPGPGDPPEKPQCGCNTGGAVDFASGTENLSRTDLAVTGGLAPFSLQRVYRSEDPRIGPFGVGTGHNYELMLDGLSEVFVSVSASRTQASTTTNALRSVFLVQPNNDRIRFSELISQPGSFINEDKPEYRGAVMAKSTSNTYSLKLKTGETLWFERSATASTKTRHFMSRVVDRNGNTITITRDPGHNVTKVSSVSGELTFTVDAFTGLVQ